MQGDSLPERIEPDAIFEALVEFRFEHTELPELVLGRLLDLALWEGYAQVRLPAADIPQPIRESDQQLRFQPLVEFRKSNGNRVAKIGGHVLSYHVTGPYPGWTAYREEIGGILLEATAKLKSPQLSRIGIRYINVLRPDKHHVRGLADTNVVLKVGNAELIDSVVVNYMRSGERHSTTVRIATPDLVAGNVPPGFSLLCDIDVATKAGLVIGSYDEAMGWIEDAHTLEKTEFFALLPREVVKKLNPKSEGSHVCQ
jgi:uncharacterized protein (TIGR04255 family)